MVRYKKKLTDLTAKLLFDRIAGILPASKVLPKAGRMAFHRNFVIASTINLITGIAVNFAILFSFSFSSHAEEEKKALFDAYVTLDSKTEIAIQRAQTWIAGIQCADGSWNTRYGRNNTGEIALAILALMVNGTVPGEGKYSKEIGRGIQFLLNSQKESGLIAGAPDSQAPMYQHALATIALAESYGMTSNPRIRTVLIKAVNLIVEVQDSAGGWRYQPRIERGDISASVMQVMALRASAEAGIYVPDDTIERAVRFIKGCYNPREKGFGYMGGNQAAAFPRTGAGLVSLQSVGLHDDPIVPDVVKYLLDNGFNERQNYHHYWYGHYYTSIALYHYGGAPWETYYPKIKERILRDWERTGHHNELLVTSWAVLILGVPYRYLPIYQR